MAVVDPEDNYIVVRIVYDGAPLAGKTTSVAALARGLNVEMHTPAEFNGRTLYFDWLDYRGGLLEGHRIRCQVISVPGQLTLGARRQHLLRTADAVVFVGESTPQGLAEDKHYLNELATLLRELDEPPVGVVFQANKRDLPEAAPLAAVYQTLDETGSRMAVVESIATENHGVQDAFALAVRLSLDRVRELLRLGTLQRMRPETDSAKELLASMSKAEQGDVVSSQSSDNSASQNKEHSSKKGDALKNTMAAYVLREVMRVDSRRKIPARVIAANDQNERQPAIPDSTVGSGLIWPPVDGRLLLQRLHNCHPELKRNADGSWQGTANDEWQLHSTERFASLETGRHALLAWARTHATLKSVLSNDRCIALAADGAGAYRLWQVVRSEPSLRNRLDTASASGEAIDATTLSAIVTSMQTFIEQTLALEGSLSLSLSTIGGASDKPLYVGLMPKAESNERAAKIDRHTLLATLLEETRSIPALNDVVKRLLPEEQSRVASAH